MRTYVFFVVCPCSCAHAIIRLWLLICLWLWEAKRAGKRGEKVKERQRGCEEERQAGVEWMENCQCLCCGAVAWCAALRRDNRMPALLAYLCCTPHSCFCCLLLPAKSHPAATWGRRLAPPGPCSSSSGQEQITNTNHLLILLIKETLITTELRSSAALNGHKQTISQTIKHVT